ncbi:MAG: TerB N-terminal domain-containing protein, partial [Lachnospiraceae bacterium]|nr:TerB N-terminal domain-containing protein [Lachnospiraceae bacterium]
MTDDSFDFPASGESFRPEENEILVEFRSGYSDQPLGFSRIKDREKDYGEVETESDPVPAKISEMKAIYFNFSYASRSSAWFFYQQGKFMEDYEDYVFYDRPFKRYYPTYNDLSVRQLRGYFGWRTRFREGRSDPSVPTSFLYLYIYELLDNIGVEPDEGFAELRYMDETFGAKDETMHRHLTAWTRDYVVYYDLDAACAAMYFSNVGGGARSALRSFEETGEAAPGLYEAIESLSSYHVGRSSCYKKDPEGMQQAVLKSIQRVSEYLKTKGRGTLSGHCLGTVHPHSVRLFAGAVFYDHLRYEDYTYEVSPARIYRCRRGVWTLEQDTAAERPSALIGWILRETDRQMRLQTGSGRELLPSPGSPEPLVAVVRQAVADYLQEKKEAARPKITFDMSSLGRIRRDADVVMASLLVDEPDEEQFQDDDETWVPVADEEQK